jgi:serine/threonine-protein kinase
MTSGNDKPTSQDGQIRPREPADSPGGAASLIGLVISDRYRIEKLLGEGGMGAVYQAEHTLMRKRVAIKVLHAEMSRMREVVARFEREAMAAAHIDHPNVAAATDFGKLDDGSFFLVLEFIEGISLRQLVAQGRLPLGRALNITRQIALALVRAHALGIVHRDLKPENVMLVDRDGDADFVKVLDFGIAKVPVGEITEAGNTSRQSDSAQPVLTQAGMVYGTPEYMAPEQALGNPVDARADIYALGVMTYEMLTGTRPFDADSKVKILGMQVTAPVPSMNDRAPDANIPPELEALVKKLLAKEADERVQDPKELLEALQSLTISLVAQGKLDAAALANSGPNSTQAPMSMVGAPASGALGVAPTDAMIALPSASGNVKIAGAEALAAVKKKPLPYIIGGGALLVLLLGVALVLSLGGKGTNVASDAGALPSASASGSGWAATPPPPTDDRVHDGVLLVDRGDYGSGIEKLSSLPEELKIKPEVRRALATAYAATEKNEECMVVVSAWLDDTADGGVSPVASEQKVRVMIRDAAISTNAVAADLAFGLLEKHMGTVGLDDLYDIGYGLSGQYNPKAKDRARKLLKRPDVRAKVTPALGVTLDIAVAGQSCKVKEYLEKAQADGDLRTAALLKALIPRVNSGWFGKKDALQCIHDGSLQKSISAIETRVK